MMTFNPTTLNFYYSGVELASKNVRCMPNLTDLISNPRYTVRIEYNQSQRDWLQVFENSDIDINGIQQFGYPLNFKIKHNHNTVIQDGNYSAYVTVDFEGESGGLGESYPYYDFGSFQVFLSVSAGISGFSVTPNSAFLHLSKNNACY